MGKYFVIFLMLICACSFGQLAADTIDYECRAKYDNAGDAEQCWAERIFRNEYKEEVIERFNGSVIREPGNVFSLKQDKLHLFDSAPELSAIISEGLFHPALMIGSYDKRKKGLKLNIIYIAEVRIPNTPNNRKRFKVIVGFPKMENPSVYLFELTNTTYQKSDGMDSFIRGSRMTFFIDGWVMI
jgi:hypothetical protein